VPQRIQVIAELAQFKTNLESYLQKFQYEIYDDASHCILADARMGSALTYLEKNSKAKSMLIMTDNPSLAYWQSIQKYKPEVYLLNASPQEIQKALEVFLKGEKIPYQPKSKIRFKPRELQVARLLACGTSSSEIAEQLGMTERSTRKLEHEIFEKTREIAAPLEIKNRSQFALWFWGLEAGLQCPIQVENKTT
jgi:DNA-binding NarL/FixJ family response regulator